MKITILQDYLRSGGTERQSVFLANFLKASGHCVNLLTLRPGGILATEIKGLNPRSVQSFDTGCDWLAIGLTTVLRKCSPDCIVCMGKVANSYAGFLQSRLADINVVSTVRTGKNLPFFYRWSLGRTKHIIVNTQWWKNELMSQGVNAERISVVPNPLTMNCEVANQELLRTKTRGQYGVTQESCVFICVQNFRPGKRHLDLIHSFSALGSVQRWKLWLVGDGKERKRCEQVVRQLGLETRVWFMGFRKNPVSLYAGADVAVSVSQEDSLPNFLIEAQTMGLPVIARDNRGVKEAFVPSKTGFLLTSNQKDIFTEVTNQLINDQALRTKMSEAARHFARQRFSSTHQAMRTEEVLHRTVRQRIPLDLKKIVLSRPDRIGDVVVSTACFEAIKRSFPEAKLYLIVQDYIQPLLKKHPLLEEVISLNENSELGAIQNHLQRIQPCCLVHLHHSPLIEKAAKNAGVICQIGFSSRKSKNLSRFTLPDEKKQCKKHEAEYNFDLLKMIGVSKPQIFKPRIAPDGEAKRSLLEKCPWLKNSDPYASLHLTAHGEKATLTPELFVKLACWLQEEFGFKSILVGNEKCHPSIVYFNRFLGNKSWIINTVGRLNLAELALLLQRASLVAGRDSGLTHISAAMGAPTFTVVVPLGRSLAAKRWHPLGRVSAFFEKEITPHTFETTKHYHRRYTQSITFDDIKDRIDRLLRNENQITS